MTATGAAAGADGAAPSVIPGEILPGAGEITLNPGRPVRTLPVTNTGDRPVQVGSHYHFAEANPALDFDRVAAWGHRLAVPAGTSVRFEPGIRRDVDLVPFTGARIVPGLRGDCGGPLDAADQPSTANTPDATEAADTPGPTGADDNNTDDQAKPGSGR